MSGAGLLKVPLAFASERYTPRMRIGLVRQLIASQREKAASHSADTDAAAGKIEQFNPDKA